ncbi:GLEYA domain-containing protein [Xylariales sp. PMI_506]|nr:GLEYA domain-containing protein [Xylariales sp. PMI_506]
MPSNNMKKRQAIPTFTVTVTQVSTVIPTVTVTATSVATGRNLIVPNGMTYRYFEHNFNADAVNNGFTSSFFKGRQPLAYGVTDDLDFIGQLPSDPSADSTYGAYLIQGFFIAPITGTYIFSTPPGFIDNWGYLWLGNAAYSAWNDNNVAYKASLTYAGSTGGSTVSFLQAGAAIPVTWLWANGGGPGRSYIQIQFPDDTIFTDTTGLFVQPCTPTVFT